LVSANAAAVPRSGPSGQGLSFDTVRGRWVLAVAVLGSGMVFLDGTVVNVALPDIGRSLDASTSALQWILNGYLLTLASLILLGGSLGDRYERRVPRLRPPLAGDWWSPAHAGQPRDDRVELSRIRSGPRHRCLVGA